MPANCNDCADYARMLGVSTLTAQRLRETVARVAAEKDAKLAAAKAAHAEEALGLKARLNGARAFLAIFTADRKVKPRARAEFIRQHQATAVKVLKLLEAEAKPKANGAK